MSSIHLRREPRTLEVTATSSMSRASHRRCLSSSSSLLSTSDEESYICMTYVPLSNLPTPPLSSHSNTSCRDTSLDVFLSAGEQSQFFGPAFVLTNLIPAPTSLIMPSVSLVHALLTRAHLPLETIALAVCILDSLNSRFALQWRKACPRTVGASVNGLVDERIEEQHIDSVPPELIVLSALVLAKKFLDDSHESTGYYCKNWGSDVWTCDQINATQRVLLENLGYRLLPIWEKSIINEALCSMNRAGKKFQQEICSGEYWDNTTCFGGFEGKALGMGKGNAVLGLAQQLTPAETPRAENTKNTAAMSDETLRAFSRGRESDDHLELPVQKARHTEPFPTYVDPIAPIVESLLYPELEVYQTRKE